MQVVIISVYLYIFYRAGVEPKVQSRRSLLAMTLTLNFLFTTRAVYDVCTVTGWLRIDYS